MSLQSVLTDKKTRGIYGEVNLKHILSNVFGDKNDSIYQLQHTFSTGVIADAVLYAPDPLGTICIDSKFPLEHYQLMVDRNVSAKEREEYEKQFKRLIWEHAVGADHYLVYILPHTEEVKKYISNDCYLLTQKYEKVDFTSFDFSRKGEFYINIVAVFQNPVSYRIVYEPFEIIHKSNIVKYFFLLLILLSFTLVGYIWYLRYKKEKEAKDKE